MSTSLVLSFPANFPTKTTIRRPFPSLHSPTFTKTTHHYSHALSSLKACLRQPSPEKEQTLEIKKSKWVLYRVTRLRKGYEVRDQIEWEVLGTNPPHTPPLPKPSPTFLGKSIKMFVEEGISKTWTFMLVICLQIVFNIFANKFKNAALVVMLDTLLKQRKWPEKGFLLTKTKPNTVQFTYKPRRPVVVTRKEEWVRPTEVGNELKKWTLRSEVVLSSMRGLFGVCLLGDKTIEKKAKEEWVGPTEVGNEMKKWTLRRDVVLGKDSGYTEDWSCITHSSHPPRLPLFASSESILDLARKNVKENTVTMAWLFLLGMCAELVINHSATRFKGIGVIATIISFIKENKDHL